MFKTIVVPIKVCQTDLDYLFTCNKEMAKVWNECVKLNWEYYEETKKFVSRDYLQEKINKSFSDHLYAKCIQIIIRKFLFTLSNIQKARKTGRSDIRYPYKNKKNYNTIWDVSCLKLDYQKNIIKIPKPMKLIDGKMRLQKRINIPVKKLPLNITQIELKYDNGLKLAINYFEVIEDFYPTGINNCAIDLGEIHTITSIDTNGNSLIITGRLIRSYKRFRNKELGKLKQRLSKCTNGSRNYKKYQKAIRKLLSKSKSKIKHSLHKTAKEFLKHSITCGVEKVAIGDLKHFNMNLKRGFGNKQKLAQWEYGQISKLLQSKLERYKITMFEVSERFTSQTCPKCKNKYKPSGRNYICKKCGYSNHRDVLGATNILSKYLHNKIVDLNLPLKKIKYLRI